MTRALPPPPAPDEPLLATRLAPPPLRAPLVERRRLQARLRRALDHTLTLIVAPAGSGKTTLLAGWLASLEGAVAAPGTPAAVARSAWLSLDEGDDDPARFWRYLLAAIERCAPGCTAAAAELLRAGPAQVEPALTALINSLAGDGRRLLVAIDDYHLIRAPAIHGGIAFMVEHAPAGLRLLIASRSVPALPLERLRVRGRLLELDAADLSFSEPEAAALLGQSMGLELRPDVVAALVERTEGWGAGLVLAALAARGRADPTAYAHSFGGASQLVLDYVMAEVLRGQPEEVRAFLLRSAPLNQLSAELCDAVAGRDDSRELLERVERAGLFLIPLDDGRRWYRYHHLFAEVLRARLARSEPALLRETRSRAAAWFASRGLLPEAVAYALAAEAWPQAAGLIAEAGYAALMRGETATVRAWLDALPPAAAEGRAELALLDGWLLILAGDISGAAARVARAEAAGVGAEHAEELRALRAIAAVMGGHLGGLDLADLPIERLPRAAFVRAVQALARGLHAEFHGAVGAAAAAYSEAARLSAEGGSLLVSFIAWCQLGEVQIVQGRLRDAEASYILADGLRHRDPATALAIGEVAQIGLGVVAFERGEHARAEALIRAGIAGSLVLGEIAAIEARTYLAQIAAARGDFAAASAEIAAAETLARASGFAPLLPLVAALGAHLDAERGELGRAAAWLAAVEGQGLDALPEGLRELVDLGRARVLTALGRHDEALATLDSVAVKAEAAGRARALMECLVVRASALAGRGRAAASRAAMEAAAALAAAEGYVTVLAGGGASPVSPRPQPPAPLGGGHDLTARELEVLRLIDGGLGNDEIARRLVVAPGTVKKHINRIFAKLAATSRTQAIVRARALGLLE